MCLIVFAHPGPIGSSKAPNQLNLIGPECWSGGWPGKSVLSTQALSSSPFRGCALSRNMSGIPASWFGTIVPLKGRPALLPTQALDVLEPLEQT
jgi:hypothetical protein